MTDEEQIIPKCCWCGGALRLDGRIAWCDGKHRNDAGEVVKCRARQMGCAVSVKFGGKRKLLFVPSPRQTEVMEASDPNLFVWGNRGGGKSVCIRWLCHALACAVPGFKYAILRTSYPELKLNHLDYLEDEMNQLGGEKRGYRYNRTDHVCYYPNGSIGYFKQCANDADVKKILGAELVLVVFDEAPTFQWAHMRLIAGSLRAVVGSGLQPMTRYLGNPIGESIDELWHYFIDQDVDLHEDPEYRPHLWRAIEMRIEDNPHLDAKTYWKQFSGLPKHWIKAWREGIRIDEDALFEFLPAKNGKPYHVIHDVPRLSDGKPLYTVDPRTGAYKFPEWVRIYRAYDHGFHPDPAVCLWFAVFGRRVLVFKEMTWSRTLVKTIARDIKQESKGMRVSETFCDPSIDVDDGQDIVTIKGKFEANGVPMVCSVNNREFFADAIHSLLDDQIAEDTPRVQILDRCRNLVKWLPRMKYDPKKPSAMAAHKQDHWPVAMAYFGMSNIPTTDPKRHTTPRRWQLPKNSRAASYARVLARQHDRRIMGIDPH